jgi:hypothetical protein
MRGLNRRLGATGVVAVSMLLACGGKDSESTSTMPTGGLDGGLDGSGTASDSTGVEDSGGTRLDLPGTDTSGTATDEGGQGCNGTWPPTDATVTGRVFAPNMEIPISGALVYLTQDPVDPIPDGVYCAECVTLECDQPYVLTAADGTFSLPAVSGTGWQLVVQKGQFLRVSYIDVNPGTTQVPASQVNLPPVWNPSAGMWIPRIGVYDTDPDAVYNVLAKFGLGQVDALGNLVPGTEQFTMISDTDQGAAMDDLNAMNQFHIMFVPCASTKYWIGAPTVPSGRIDNIRAYVEAGGKWYATDHSNEYIKEPFPIYQDFYAASMPDIQPAYTSVGTVVDTGMLDWLQALPDTLKDIGGGNETLFNLPQVTTNLSYSGIDAVHPVIVQDAMGMDVDVGHHTFVEGPCQSCTSDPTSARPMAITGGFGCGRLMYSTFETSSSAHNGLNPQELMLLYMILEIGVCHGDPPPPPPPID